MSSFFNIVFHPCRQTQPIHNIAEELDPTFKARKRDSLLMGNTAPSGQYQNYRSYITEPKITGDCVLLPYCLPCLPQVFVWPIEPLIPCSMTTCQSPLSSRPLSAKVTDQDDPKPKRRGKTANSSDGVCVSVFDSVRIV